MSDSSSSSGMGLFGVLLVIFIVLKLVGVITWSWWLVLIPLWIDLGLAFLILMGLLMGGWTGSNLQKKEPNWSWRKRK